ncbi:MAG TPA: prolyl oligopeptidase family serine peptidase [Steroidobacter sp.]
MARESRERSERRLHFGWCITYVVLCVLFCRAEGASAAASANVRPLQVEDLFTVEVLVDVSASPDGKSLVVARSRDKASQRAHMVTGTPYYRARSDLWIRSIDGDSWTNLTNGQEDSSGYWNPVWSPDSARLVFLSTRGLDNVRLYVWERGRGEIRRVHERGVSSGTVFWADSNKLTWLALPPGAAPWTFDRDVGAERRISDGLVRKVRGEETTATVWSSVPSHAAVPRADVMMTDMTTGQTRSFASIPFIGPNPVNQALILSPDRRYVAVLAASEVIPQPERSKVGPLPARAQVQIISLQTLSTLHGPTDAVLQRSMSAMDGPVFEASWSPDSSTFAMIGRPRSRNDSTAAILSLSVPSGAVRVIDSPDMPIARLTWSQKGRLLVYGRAKHDEVESRVARYDWYGVSADGGFENLTRTMPSVAPEIFSMGHSDQLLTAGAGKLWTIDVERATAELLTHAAGLRQVETLSGMDCDPREAYRCTVVLAELKGRDAKGFATIRLKKDGVAISELLVPRSDAVPVRYLPAADRFMFTNEVFPQWSVRRDGPVLWIEGRTEGTFTELLALNSHMASVAEGQRIPITYHDYDGNALNAIALLPVGYEAGKRYPLVVWVYAGRVYSGLDNYALNKISDYYLNLQLLAARGYVVLLPSIPLERGKSDPLLDAPKAVLPAIDEMIDRGIVDPDRIAVMGHSYGGYTVYALLANTDRFKAAVALAGLANLVSEHGQFDVRLGHDESPLRLMSSVLSSANAQGDPGKGYSPYENRWFWERNNPINYADRMTTPLLIVQGDVDHVSVAQGEEMFTALYRLGRRVEFARYWGEAHNFVSPANITDLWKRLYDWFDTWLNVPRDAEGRLLWSGNRLDCRAKCMTSRVPARADDYSAGRKRALRSTKTSSLSQATTRQ